MVKIPKNVQKMNTISGVGSMYPHHSFSIRYFIIMMQTHDATRNNTYVEMVCFYCFCYIICVLDTHTDIHYFHTFIDGQIDLSTSAQTKTDG